MSKGRKIQGIECPIIREGDNLVDIVVDSVLKETHFEDEVRIYSTREWCLSGLENKPTCVDEDGSEYKIKYVDRYNINDKDIIGITESVVARAAGQYVTVDEIAADIEKKFGKDATICLVNPIYSRNRFSMILKGIARATKKVVIIMPEHDEVGNPRGVNRFTGVNIEEYYEELCESENCECSIFTLNGWSTNEIYCYYDECVNYIYCGLHDYKEFKITDAVLYYTLADICSDKSPDWGLLGTNKATDERLKLFPSKAECQRVCEGVKAKIKEKTGKDVIVCIYGDGCFKDPVGGIWEFADPVSMPGYTDKDIIEGTPNEIKLKSVIDNGFNDEQIYGMIDVHKNTNKPHMGTTPRVCRDLLASLMDLTSGSGDKATPVVLVSNYF